MNKIKKGDQVKVITGKDKGKTGEVLALVKKEDQQYVVIKQVNVVKKHQKPNPNLGITGGIIDIEKPIHVSNVMLVDNKSGQPTRVGFKVEKDKKVRISNTSKEVIK
jgi:large subunit ribosomal protein L24